MSPAQSRSSPHGCCVQFPEELDVLVQCERARALPQTRFTACQAPTGDRGCSDEWGTTAAPSSLFCAGTGEVGGVPGREMPSWG